MLALGKKGIEELIASNDLIWKKSRRRLGSV